jgi:hypothetical protein
MRHAVIGLFLLLCGRLAGGQGSLIASCEAYRSRYERLNVGDTWTKIISILGRSTSAEDTSDGGTVYRFEFTGCKLSFKADSDGKRRRNINYSYRIGYLS